MMTDFENRVYEALSRIESRQSGVIEKLDGLHDQLLAPGGRILKIEAALEWSEKKQWIHTVIIVPTISILVGAAKKLGLI
jgi:hypothetical protein